MELLAPFGNVRAKRMFGGYGIFKDELMFGLVADEIKMAEREGFEPSIRY